MDTLFNLTRAKIIINVGTYVNNNTITHCIFALDEILYKEGKAELRTYIKNMKPSRNGLLGRGC